MRQKTLLAFGAGIAMTLSAAVQAQTSVEMDSVSKDGVGDSIGTVTAEDTDYGLLLTPDLSGLKPGIHGFHLHQNASCETSESDGEVTPAGAAGGHFDPEETGTHQGPYTDEGHLGDMPALMVDSAGNATTPVLAPRLEESDLGGHAFMIHEGGDNYSDEPKLGGGGGRVACGVIEQGS
ncbi:superoxide dismutase family protein [Salinicola rhizosphaerae]|uniref:Superoxide dismutase [Cu-Zn] n=1 Tax=Salinicola rhizosphaerae TaxID=1443141 RepID=A0ABQ3EAE5_9GAMM|nr:superoxide dismutase family protein [Salinicola rhizosphaerae]GHB31631.1 superoxide dismutase [Cu-Zn] [Salinicola rhizosphaerae]